MTGCHMHPLISLVCDVEGLIQTRMRAGKRITHVPEVRPKRFLAWSHGCPPGCAAAPVMAQ